MRIKEIPLRIAFIFLALLCLAHFANAEQSIRIAVYRSTKTVTVKGDGIKIGVISSDGTIGEVVGTNPKKVRINIQSGKMAIEGIETLFDAITLTAPSKLLSIDDKVYHAPLKVVADSGKPPSIVVVSEVPLENYLVSVVGSEVPSSWPMESLKAQAVAARSYAVYQILLSQDKFYHLEATVSDQVYSGAVNSKDSIANAVEETHGEVLTYNNEPIAAFFHSCCGGVGTESAEQAWGNALPYLPRVSCKYCKDCPRSKWSVHFNKGKLEKALKSAGILQGKFKSISVGKKLKSGRVKTVEVVGAQGTSEIDVNKFRGYLGYDSLYSPYFEIDLDGDEYIFSGRGSGHGVGMCQWGARGMALKGKSYKQILSHYYPGASLVKMY